MHRSHVTQDLTWVGDPNQVFELKEKVGEGAFGEVYKAVHRETGFVVAVKIIPVTNSSQAQTVRKEIELMRQIRNANVVSYFGTSPRLDKMWSTSATRARSANHGTATHATADTQSCSSTVVSAQFET